MFLDEPKSPDIRTWRPRLPGKASRVRLSNYERVQSTCLQGIKAARLSLPRNRKTAPIESPGRIRADPPGQMPKTVIQEGFDMVQEYRFLRVQATERNPASVTWLGDESKKSHWSWCLISVTEDRITLEVFGSDTTARSVSDLKSLSGSHATREYRPSPHRTNRSRNDADDEEHKKDS
jgi:hypothetical protein